MIYGGLGHHVTALSRAQAALGNQVTVLTQSAPGAPDYEVVDGVTVVRCQPPSPQLPRDPKFLISWVDQLNEALTQALPSVVASTRPDVIHVHDWVVGHVAKAVRELDEAPLVATIHAMEAGRHQGWIHGDVSRTIHSREFELATIAKRVITCSTRMRQDVAALFAVSPERIDVIPNGLDTSAWAVDDEDKEQARQRWAPEGSLIVFVGRLEWEKGVQTLISALGQLKTSNVHTVIAGKGTYAEHLLAQAHDLVEAGAITFTGWLPLADLRALQAAADVAVVPSLYEPFGIVALEPGALGVPVVVADTGGLTDIVDHGEAGLTFPSGDAAGLAAAIDEALNDQAGNDRRLARMSHLLESTFRWDLIAEQTNDTYAAAIADSSTQPIDVEPPVIPQTNLFATDD